MDPVHELIVNTQWLMTGALIFIAFLTLMAICVTLWTIQVTRRIGRETAEILAEMRAANDRMSHYLFVRLGPAELK